VNWEQYLAGALMLGALTLGRLASKYD